MSFDDDYLIDQQFGGWLRDIRTRKKFRIHEASRESGIPLERLQDLEDGVAEMGVTSKEIESLSQLYNIDPRAIRKKAIHGDME